MIGVPQFLLYLEVLALGLKLGFHPFCLNSISILKNNSNFVLFVWSASSLIVGPLLWTYVPCHPTQHNVVTSQCSQYYGSSNLETWT